MTKKLIVEMDEGLVRSLDRLIRRCMEHDDMEFTSSSMVLSNDRWWQERDTRLSRMDGDLLRCIVDLYELKDCLDSAV